MKLLQPIFCAALSLSLFACGGVGGTESGNPTEIINAPETSRPDGNVTPFGNSGAGVAMIAVCYKLTGDCFKRSVAYDDCINQMMIEPNLPAAFGADGTTYANLDQLITAEITREISSDPDKADLCAASIEQTTCAEVTELGAYDAEHPKDFSQIAAIFRDPACSEIY